MILENAERFVVDAFSVVIDEVAKRDPVFSIPEKVDDPYPIRPLVKRSEVEVAEYVLDPNVCTVNG